MRTGIRCGVAPKYVMHLYETTADGGRKALGGHKLGRWAPLTRWTLDLDLVAVETRFQSSGGDGLCKSCRRVAAARVARAFPAGRRPLSDADPPERWQAEAERLGVPVETLREQIRLADEVISEIIAEERAENGTRRG